MKRGEKEAEEDTVLEMGMDQHVRPTNPKMLLMVPVFSVCFVGMHHCSVICWWFETYFYVPPRFRIIYSEHI